MTRAGLGGPPAADWPIAAVVAAAGAGRRFGGRKLVAPWPGGTILSAVVRALAQGGLAPIVVVVAADGDAEGHAAREAGAEVVVRPPEASGDLGISIARGVAALPGGGGAPPRDGPAPAIAVALGDLPRLRPGTVARLAAAWRADPAGGQAIVVPAHAGRRGHPVVFGPAHAAALAALGPGDRPRDVLVARSSRVREVDVDDDGIWRDVDRPSDLDRPGSVAPG